MGKIEESLSHDKLVDEIARALRRLNEKANGAFNADAYARIIVSVLQQSGRLNPQVAVHMNEFGLTALIPRPFPPAGKPGHLWFEYLSSIDEALEQMFMDGTATPYMQAMPFSEWKAKHTRRAR